MSLFQRSNVFSMTPREVQEIVEKTGKVASYVASNKTEAVQTLTNGIIDSTKGVITTHSGTRIGGRVFKDVKDYAKGDILCTGICTTFGICETATGVLIWIPVPDKICAVFALKGVSYGCMKIRDLCASEPGNLLC